MQKSTWGTLIGILQSKAEPEATLFAAITLRGKVAMPSNLCTGRW